MDVDICRVSNDVFDKDINLLVSDAAKQDQSGKMSSAANDLAIIEELNKEKMSEKEIGPAISSQLAEVATKYWSEESKNSVVVTKILNGLKIPANCSGICGPILNEAVAKNRRIMPFHKRADKRLSDIQKRLIFATSAVLQIADELILAHNEIRPPNLGKVMGHTVDFITLMGRAHKQISAELAVKSFVSASHKHIKIMSDNATTIHCINKMGISHSMDCHHEVLKIWEWAIG